MTTQKFKQTEIGKIPEDWEVGKIGDLVNVYGGFAIKSADFISSGVPVIKIKNIQSDGSVNVSDTEFISQQNFSKQRDIFKLHPGEFVIAMTGATIGKIGKIPSEYKEYMLNQRVASFNSKKIFDKDFIFHIFRSSYIQNAVINSANGAAQQNISSSQIENIKIAIPKDDEERKQIASILSSLDAKIELNNKTNKTLEAIGQAIFKKWFVDNPEKEGWEEGKLGDLLENVKNSLVPGESLKDRKYVPIDNLPMKKIGLNSYLPYTEANSSLVAFEKDDILIGAMRVYFHRVNLAPFKGITRTTTFILRPKNKKHLSFCLFLLNQDATIEFANSHSKGSTMPYAVWNNSFENMPVSIPEEKTLEEFNNLIYPILSKVRDTIFENQSLSQIRDSLLPKLMSGEIRVPIN